MSSILRGWLGTMGAGWVVLGALLLLTPTSLAAQVVDPKGRASTSTDSRRARARLTPAAFAFSLRYSSIPPSTASSDRWLGRDKAKHVVGGALWTLSTQYVLVSKAGWTESRSLPVSVASGVAAGVTKELYDASRPNGEASGRDLLADAVGIGVAVGIILL